MTAVLPRRTSGVLILSLALALAIALTPTPASANHINDHRNIILPDPNPNGPTEWSIRWSTETFDTAPRVLIGRGDDFPDSLASGALQGSTTPLLLTDPQALSEGIIEEVRRLGAATFDVIGGEEAVSQAVVDELQAEGLVQGRRIEGPTRFETAVAAAQGQVASTVLIVRGTPADEPTQAFADSLAAGGWAADEGWPILLTQTDRLHPATAEFLAATPTTITRAIIVGGTDAVGGTNESDLAELGLEVQRVAGDDRAGTAVAVAQARGFDAVADADRFLVVEAERDDAYALGFPAAAHSALADAPAVLLTGGEIPAATQAWLAGGTPRAQDVQDGDPLFVCAAAPPACAGPVRAAIGLPAGAVVTLAADEGPYAVGDVLTGSAMVDDEVEATLELSGPCIDDGPVPVAEDGSFTTEITSGEADEDSASSCTIRYRVTYANGTVQGGSFTVAL